PVPESQLSVAINAPTDGAQLTKSDDVDPAKDGIQTNITATATDTAGREIKLESAELLLKADGATDWTASGVAATISGASVAFSAVTLPPSNVSLRVNVKEQGTSRTAFAQISIGVPTSTACSLQITSPAGLNVTLTQAQDAKPAVAGA